MREEFIQLVGVS